MPSLTTSGAGSDGGEAATRDNHHRPRPQPPAARRREELLAAARLRLQAVRGGEEHLLALRGAAHDCLEALRPLQREASSLADVHMPEVRAALAAVTATHQRLEAEVGIGATCAQLQAALEAASHRVGHLRVEQAALADVGRELSALGAEREQLSARLQTLRAEQHQREEAEAQRERRREDVAASVRACQVQIADGVRPEPPANADRRWHACRPPTAVPSLYRGLLGDRAAAAMTSQRARLAALQQACEGLVRDLAGRAGACERAALASQCVDMAALQASYAQRLHSLEQAAKKRPRRSELPARRAQAEAQLAHIEAGLEEEAEELRLLNPSDGAGYTADGLSPPRGLTAGGAVLPADLLRARVAELQSAASAYVKVTLPALRRQADDLRSSNYEARVLAPEEWLAERRRHEAHVAALRDERSVLEAKAAAARSDVAALRERLSSAAAGRSSRAVGQGSGAAPRIAEAGRRLQGAVATAASLASPWGIAGRMGWSPRAARQDLHRLPEAAPLCPPPAAVVCLAMAPPTPVKPHPDQCDPLPVPHLDTASPGRPHASTVPTTAKVPPSGGGIIGVAFNPPPLLPRFPMPIPAAVAVAATPSREQPTAAYWSVVGPQALPPQAPVRRGWRIVEAIHAVLRRQETTDAGPARLLSSLPPAAPVKAVALTKDDEPSDEGRDLKEDTPMPRVRCLRANV